MPQLLGFKLRVSNVDNSVCDNNIWLIEEWLKINKTRTTALQPQSDRMVERFSRTFLPHLSKVFDEHQEDWDHYIPLFMVAHRSAIHKSTRHTPAKVIFGHELKLPCDVEFGTQPEKLTPIDDFVMEMRNCLIAQAN